jgi:hypothetical protein
MSLDALDYARNLRALADEMQHNPHRLLGDLADDLQPDDLRHLADLLERMTARGNPEAAQANQTPI